MASESSSANGGKKPLPKIVRALVKEYGKAARKHGEFSAIARAARKALEAELRKLPSAH